MQDQHPRRPVPLGLIAGFSALVLATGSAAAWWAWTSSRNILTPTKIEASQSDKADQKAPSVSVPNQTETSSNSTSVPTEATLQVYWLKPSGNTIELASTPLKLSSTSSSNDLLRAALTKLLAGPDETSMTTTIPRGTELRSLSIQNDGIHIDLSQEFASGGGSTSMTGRVAQVLYTATSLKPTAPIWLSVEGKPLETLGGEGLMLDQPLTRQNFSENFLL